jgi:glycosyltransferase involved in cell wall biosynthesis
MRTVSAPRRQTVVMLTTSYPRFPGDGVGTFMEPIARGVAARGHEVHVVAPWHPLIRRPDEAGVRFHFFRYAPVRALNVFGYAAALKADVTLRPAAYLAAPLALAAGWRAVRRVAGETGATMLHAHWAIPSGVMAAASGIGVPLVVSLHGSDVFVAEANPIARRAARFAFHRAGWITACSADLRRRAIDIGAAPDRVTVVPYGVDGQRFRPSPATRSAMRSACGLKGSDRVVVAAGRLVRKKGFEYLIEAVAALAARWPTVTLVIAGGGDLEDELRGQATACGIAPRVRFVGAVTQTQVAEWLAAADVAVVPSVRDDAGNVDGLPNIVLEALVSGTPVIATPAGGIGTVAVDGETALVVPERDVAALTRALEQLLEEPDRGRTLGQTARESVRRTHDWSHVAEQFEETYERASTAPVSG